MKRKKKNSEVITKDERQQPSSHKKKLDLETKKNQSMLPTYNIQLDFLVGYNI